VGLWVKMLEIPRPLLYGGVLVLATIGTYGITRSPVDLIVLYAMGRHGARHAPLRLPAQRRLRSRLDGGPCLLAGLRE
jgi:TctA family transporter